MLDDLDGSGDELDAGSTRSTFSRIYMDQGKSQAKEETIFAEHECPDPLCADTCQEVLRREKALTESRQLFETLVDAMFDAYYDWDLSTHPLASLRALSADGASDWTIDEVGAAPSDVAVHGQVSWRARIHPDDSGRVWESIDEAVRERASYQEEYRLQRLDGSYAIVEDRGLIVCDESGEAAHIIGAVRDISRERHYAQSLEERNTALRVLVEQRDTDRRELEQKITANLENLVLPALMRLQKSLGSRPEAIQLDALRDSILEVTSSFGLIVSGSGSSAPLTRRETEIAQLVRAGKTTAEIAETLYLSPQTVAFHRKNIRRKLGLSQRGSHLSTYFAGEDELTGP